MIQSVKKEDNMSTINGFGTKMLGDFEYYEDNSYVSIYFIVILFIPIFPLATYRVFEADEEDFPSLPVGTSKSTYKVQRIPMKWKYAWQLLRVVYGVFIGIGGLIYLTSEFLPTLLGMTLCLIGILFLVIGGMLFVIKQYEG